MIHLWKARHLAKGVLTYVPALRRWRSRRALTGGTDSSRYCYTIWLRHLAALHRQGFSIAGANIGELGPGDSIGVGLAALLSGGESYVGLDAIPYFANVNLDEMLTDLARLFSEKAPTSHAEAFPDEAVHWPGFDDRLAATRAAVRAGIGATQKIRYQAPWTSGDVILAGTLDLVFSEGVLQSIDELEQAYRTMFKWLKPGGYGSHALALSANQVSHYWNGHWAYSDWEWRIVRGARPFLINREPLSTHLRYAERAGFEIVSVTRRYYTGGLDVSELAPRFQAMDPEDLRTSRAILMLRKPPGAAA
jgi:SAM-dependent methyltransferase